jgi:ABC-2 type transport system permease protein
VALVIFVGIGLVLGGLCSGFDPLTSLSGTPISAGRGMLLIAASALPYLLSEQFDASQGLLRDPTNWTPIVHATWISACYAVPAVLWAFLAFVRRAVAG